MPVQLSRVCTAIVLLACCAWALDAGAQTTAPATQAGGKLAIKDLSDKQCMTYANAKTIFADGGMKVEFGTGTGIFGGAWFPVSAPKFENGQCHGIALTVRGNGNAPGRAFLSLKTASGAYRSKNLNTLFEKTDWQDVVLTADDFIVDPDVKKKEGDAETPKTPEWNTLKRIDFSAVNIDTQPALEFKSMAFLVGGPAPVKAAETAPAAKPDVAAKYPGLKMQSNAGGDALTPIAKQAKFSEGTWLERHEQFVARAKQGEVELLWLGDSITDFWSRAKGTYAKLFPNIKSANFGIGGDGTQNLLWRLENGELEGIQPKVAIVLIGANNVQWHKTEQIAAAIERIVQTVRAKSPKTKVLVMGIFPRADIPASSPGHQRARDVNAIIAKLDDGKSVRYLDIGGKLSKADGTILEDAFADKVHLSNKGFTIWGEAIRPLLDEMMK